MGTRNRLYRKRVYASAFYARGGVLVVKTIASLLLILIAI